MRKNTILFMLVSLIVSGIIAFYVTSPNPDLVSTEFIFNSNVSDILENSLFRESLYSSLLIGFCCSIISTIIGFSIGRGISRINFNSKKMPVLFFTLPLFFVAIIIVIFVHILLMKLSIDVTISGIIFTNVILIIPYSISIGTSLFADLPKEFESVSRMLGVSRLNTFSKIVFPLLKGGMVVSMCLTFLVCIVKYFLTFLIGGGEMVSIAGMVYPRISNFDFQVTILLCLVFVLISLCGFKVTNTWIKGHAI